MSEPVFIVGDSLVTGHPGLEVTQISEDANPSEEEVDAALEKLREEAQAKEEAASEPTSENEDGVEVNAQDANRDELADVIPDVGGFSHVFGDTDTAIGGTSDQEVVSSDNEKATVVAAAAEAEGEDVSHDEARRQVDVEAGTIPSSEAGENDEDDPDGDGPRKTAAETVEDIKAAGTVGEVDALADNDERKTVQDAADARRKQLEDE